MTTYQSICIKDFVVEAQNGDRLELSRGREYITSPVQKNNKVVVFSNFWVSVPADIFAGSQLFTGGE